MIPERLERLRSEMKKRNIAVYVVPTADYHESEYVGEHFKARKYITGFTGSAGTAVITMDEAGLWTDGRYFLQAAAQLEGRGKRLAVVLHAAHLCDDLRDLCLYVCGRNRHVELLRAVD